MTLIDTGDRVALSLLGQAEALERSARLHKRRERYHRREAQKARASLAALESRLARMGVRLVTGEAPGEERHGRDEYEPGD